MENIKAGFGTIDEYVATFPLEVQLLLQQIRATIKAAAPEATEKISYQMPTFFLHGNLIHFAAFKHHIGIYPAPSGIEAFADELSVYVGAKGSVRLPLDKPLPLELITRMVEFRVAENLQKAKGKSGKSKSSS
ncbi:MAG: iron chaperone [Anaerolineae bacterium]